MRVDAGRARHAARPVKKPNHLARRRPRPPARLPLPAVAVRGGLLVLGVVLASLAVLGLARAAGSLEVTVGTTERYFSPDGDGQEDIAEISYCLSQAANVDIWVTGGSGARVRTIEEGVSHAGSCGRWEQAAWDGKDDTARLVADGVYTVHLRARTADAESGEVTVRLGVDTRTPGRLTRPAPNAVLSGTVDWAFTPTAGFGLGAVSVSCQGDGSGVATSDTPGADGRFAGTLDVSGCSNGDNLLHSAVSWTDPFGQEHRWSAPAVEVILDNPPQLTVQPQERYFSPDGDGQDDSAAISYCLSQPATVDIWVADGSGARVRTIEDRVSHGGGHCTWVQGAFEWDGRDDEGRVVADGDYVAHLIAENAGGDSGGASVRLGVDTRAPGALTTPSRGATLSGTVAWAFTPTAGFDVQTVQVSCQGGSGGSATSGSPGTDGRFTGDLDVSGCSHGDNLLHSAVSWTDPFGHRHSWSAPALPVTVEAAPQVSLTSPERYFSPDGDGQEDTVTVGYCLSQEAAVDVWVTDQAGARVRTIEAQVSHPANACNWDHSWFSWDGRDDHGQLVADGVYTAHLTARNAAGDSGDLSTRVGVDTRAPGALTAPTPDTEVSGTVEWAFTPTGGFDLQSVGVSCQGGGSSSGAADQAGRFTGTLDVSGCSDGDNQVQASVWWTDPFGQQHGWSAPAVPVTVRSAPRVSLASPERYFSPDGDDQEDTVTVAYCLSQAAELDIWVADRSGARVRTVENDTAHPASSSCGWDRGSFDWDGRDDAGRVVADGVYTVHLEARNAGGSGEATTQVGVDTRSPGAVTSPAAGDTLAGLARFAFRPGAGFTPDRVDLSFDTGGQAAIHNASADGLWRTSMYTGSLQRGPATLHASVSYRDPFGADHLVRVAEVPVVIDDTALPVTAAADPAGGPAPLATTIHITTSDPQARSVHYTVSFGDGTAPATGTIDAPYAVTDVAHTYRDPGAYTAVVTVTNGAGASSTRTVEISASGAGNTAPTATLELDATSGVAPLPVEATIGGADADGDPLGYSLDFGDGGAPVTGSLPDGPVTRTYDKAGTYLVRLAVRDGRLTTVKTATVVVGLAEPLAADAGDDQAAAVNDPVRFDGSGSRPPAGIESYRWDFGDGTGAEGAAVEHAYATAGTYTATLTVTAGGRSERDSTTVTVAQRPALEGLVVSARDEGGAPVAGAELVVVAGSGTRYSATTDAGGSGTLQGLVDGTYTIYAWRQGYLPAKTTGTVTGGSGEATVTLKPGQVATASLTSTPLTRDEVIAAGIDPDDPDNQHVYEFKIHLAFESGGGGATPITGYTASGGFPLCPLVDGARVECGPTGASFAIDSGYHVSMSVSYVHDQPQIVWLVIPGKATWLKEFFSVQMMVSNLADPDFTLASGSATLAFPNGLTLAPTTVRQAATVPLPPIPGGQSKAATWVLRGDTEGFYDLSASYVGTLEPFGDTVTVRAVTDKPLHVWGGSALELVVDVDDQAWDRFPYRATVGLKNVADVPVYNASVELLKDGKLNYIYQPREQLTISAPIINPGETLRRTYILVPSVTGTLDLGRSFVSKTAGDVELPAQLTSHPPVATPATTPKLSAEAGRSAVRLTWEPVPGATAYELYATPDRVTDFPADPVGTAPATQTTMTVERSRVPAGGWYAIRTILADGGKMLHPLVDASAGPNRISLAAPDAMRVGQPLTLTATVTDAAGQAAPNVPLAFRVLRGPNAGFTGSCSTADCRTDAAGRVSWTYYGGAPGQDTVEASQGTNGGGTGNAGAPNARISVRWQAGPRGARLTPASGPPGTRFTARYSCPSGQAPSIQLKPADASPTPKSGLDIGLPVSGNGRDYRQTLQVGPDGTYLAAISCGGQQLAELPFAVIAQGFVGIGDSYSSGEGASVFDPATDTATNRCHRAATGQAWQRMVAGAYGRGFDFGACSGAVIEDFLRFNPAHTREIPQLDHISRRGATSLVTFSIGGNNVGFGDVLASCIVGVGSPGAPGCKDRQSPAMETAMRWLTDGGPDGCRVLPGVDPKTSKPREACSAEPVQSLHQTYEAAAERLGRNGRVLVAGYPRLFGNRLQLFDPFPGIRNPPLVGCKVGTAVGSLQFGITAGDIAWLNSMGERLNQMIAQEVTRARENLRQTRPDVTISFVSVDEAFETHRLCDARQPWLRGLEFNTRNLFNDGVKQVSFHPKDAGQRAIGAVVRSRL